MKPFIFLLAFALALTPIALAQPAATPGKKPAAAKTTVLPIVIVTKKDGTPVRGRLVSADHNAIVLKVENPADKTSEDQTFKWSEVSKLSNGLTRAKALETFKAEKRPEELCETCKGNLDARCSTCKGTAHTAEAVANCTACKGELLVDCKTPKCEEGQSPCPNKQCLKLTEGRWFKKDDGLMWRNFSAGKGATFSWSEKHVGEVVAKEGDSWVNKGKCPTCEGKTTLTDPACEGTGKIPCPAHAKATDHACSTCEASGRTPCTACKGSGLKPNPPPAPAPTPETNPENNPDGLTPPTAPATPPPADPATGADPETPAP